MSSAKNAGAPTPDSTTRPGAQAAETIRLELARQRRSGRQLAAAVGWSAGTTSRRLNGETPLTVDELYACASFLGLPVARLLPAPEALAGLRALELAS